MRPRLIIAMGATAGRALLGRAVAVGKERGRLHSLPDGTPCWITTHPSALLRLPPEADKEAAFAALVDDLRQAAAAV